MEGGRETLWQRIWWIARGPVRALLCLAHAVGLIHDPLARMRWTCHYLVDDETRELFEEHRYAPDFFEATADASGFEVRIGIGFHWADDAKRIVWRSVNGEDWTHTETLTGNVAARPSQRESGEMEEIEEAAGLQHQVTLPSGVRIRAIERRAGFKGGTMWSTIDRQIPGRDWQIRVYSFRGAWARHLVDRFVVTEYGVLALGHSERWGFTSKAPPLTPHRFRQASTDVRKPRATTPARAPGTATSGLDGGVPETRRRGRNRSRASDRPHNGSGLHRSQPRRARPGAMVT